MDAVTAGIPSVVVRGRAERVDVGQPFAVLVDYAHAPGELDAVLAAARALAGGQGRGPQGHGKVIVVFGCGGDRDPSKRPLMGAAAGRGCRPGGAHVRQPAVGGSRRRSPTRCSRALDDGTADVVVELDRRAAIRHALRTAGAGDVVVIAGKGPETGQTIGSRTLPFDDRDVAREELGALGWS